MEDRGFAPQRVVGLVMILLKEIREKHLRLDEIESISSQLIGQGYTETEISAAFSWVYARLDGVEPAEVLFRDDPAKSSFRVLHPAEATVLKPDSYGQLVEMQALGLLQLDDVEKIIERAMSFGGPLGVEEIRLLVHNLLFEEGPHGTPDYSI